MASIYKSNNTHLLKQKYVNVKNKQLLSETIYGKINQKEM